VSEQVRPKQARRNQAVSRTPWLCTKPTVRILFYTDDERFNFDADDLGGVNGFGLYILRELITHDDSDMATFEITLVTRHHPPDALARVVDGEAVTPGPHGHELLTSERLANYDQVWFFGGRYANTTTDQQNELTDSEVAALEAWMKAGGVLMTGDHANRRRDDVDPELNELLNLGRAIGHRVPRAGKLRRWEGPPSLTDYEIAGHVTHPYNTQLRTHAGAEGDPLAEDHDEWPQRLALTTYPAPSPWPFDVAPYGERVHPLFCGRDAPIDVFPDHMHEGHLQHLGGLPAAEWPSSPSGEQPRPEVVARGTNTHISGPPIDLVIAYDGSSAGAGRIVADSTWHHYFNFNLVGFPPDGPVLRQIAQYYVNLAIWLCPPEKRSAIACYKRWKIANDPVVQMAVGSSMIALGRAATSVARRTLGPCAMREVFLPQALAAELSQNEPEPPMDLVVGGVMQAYVDAFDRIRAGEKVQEQADHLVATGVRAAYNELLAALNNGAERAQHGRQHLEEIPPLPGAHADHLDRSGGRGVQGLADALLDEFEPSA